MERPMKSITAKLLLIIMTLTIAIPESEAKRMGSGRSSGRQSSSIARQARPPAAPPAQRAEPGVARAPTPAPAAPTSPQRAPARQGSALGGMVGGALLGLGLGSLMSRGNDRQTASGESATEGENRSGAPEAAAAQEQARDSGFGSWWLFGLLALAVVFLVRRARRKKTPQYPRF
jgi:hypothetical protein